MNVNWAELDNVWAVLAMVVLVGADYIDRRRGRSKELASIESKVDIVKGEVKNDHPYTNLRDDLDHSIRIGEANARTNTRILDLLENFGRDLGDLRNHYGALREADRAHVADQDAFEKRVRDWVVREFPGAGPL